MGLYRDATGAIRDVPDEQARMYGYEPISDAEQMYRDQAALDQAAVEESGFVGTLKGFGTGILSGATLGISDLAIASAMDQGERQRLAAEMAEHDIARSGGEIVGSLLPVIPGAGVIAKASPAGYLSTQATKLAEGGTAKAVMGAAGVEGAIQNAGQYIGHAALEDKEGTVEGLAGAAGIGFGFGAAGGSLALGIEKGAIAARRMFARYADGGKDAATTAFSEWETKSKTILDADEATADVARKKLEEYRAARVAAQQENLRAKAVVEYEQGRAANAPKASGAKRSEVRTDLSKMAAGGDPIAMPENMSIGDVASPQLGDDAFTPPQAADPFPENMSVGDIPETPPVQLGDEAFAPPTYNVDGLGKPIPDPSAPGPLIRPDNRVTFGPTGEPVALEGVDIHQMVKEMQRRTTRGENMHGMRPNETISAFRARRDKMVPTYKDVKKIDVERTVDPSFFAEKGYFEPAAGFDSGVRLDKARKAMKEGQQEAIGIGISPSGEYSVINGRHRLRAAIETGTPIKVKFTSTVEAGLFSEGMRRIPARPIDDGAQWVSRKQSVAGLKGLRERFGKLAHEPSALGKVVDEEASELERVLGEFETAKAELLNKLGMADTKGLQPLRRDPRVADDIANFEKHAGAWQPDPMATAPEPIQRPDNAIGYPRPRDEFRENMQEVPDAVSRARSDEFTYRATDATSVGKRVRVLEDQVDDALERATNAANDVEREAAMAEARALEQQLDAELPDNLVGDVAKAVDAFKRYEKATAELAEVVGDGAHPGTLEHVKAVADAEDESVRRAMDRMTRAAEDAEMYGPEILNVKGRVANAKEYKAQTAGELAAAKEAERGAREASAAANKKVTSTKKQLAAEKKEMFPKTARREGAAEAGGLYEMMDIPGMPKASDIPYVGPLLSAWLKYRTIKAAMGRFTGRVPATADSKVAALSAKTKDRVAKALDNALEPTSEVRMARARSARHAATLTATVSKEIFNDGEKKVAKNKDDIQGHATDRVREIAAYVNTPGAIERDVRRELRDVTDPDIIAAAEKHRRMVMQHLLDKAPKMPEPDPLVKATWKLSPLEAMEFARRYSVVNDPASAFEAMGNGTLTLEAADTLRAAFPRLFELGQKRLLMKTGDLKESVPYRTRVLMTMLFDVPLDRSLDPRNIRIMQSVYDKAKMAAAAQAMPNAPQVTPSVAGDVNINALYQTRADRSTSRR